MKASEFRPHLWYDEEKNCSAFGIQARVGGKWMHTASGNIPNIFYSEEDRDKKLKELRESLEKHND